MYINDLSMFEKLMWLSVITVIVGMFVLAAKKRTKKPIRRALIGGGLIITSFTFYAQAQMSAPRQQGNSSYYMGPADGWQYYPILFVGIGFLVAAALGFTEMKKPQGNRPAKVGRTKSAGSADNSAGAGIDIITGS